MRDWKETEKVVRIIEKLISPHSTVEHNLKLPVLNSPSSRTRQCDVVIKTGNPPRETITIVEVQKRKSKVKINDFLGWIEKTKEVGAQHLICVSEKGFPDSVIEKARQIGPTVRLVLFKELEDGKWPLDFLERNIVQSNMNMVYAKNLTITRANKLDSKDNNSKIDFSDKIFYYNDKLVSMNQLLTPILSNLQKNKSLNTNGTTKIPIQLPQNEEKLIVKTESGNIVVKKINFDLFVNYQETIVPFQSSSYKQLDYENELAWVLESDVILNNDKHHLQLILIPKGNRDYLFKVNLKKVD